MPEFQAFIGGLEGWVRDYGVIVVFVVVMLESLGLPLPGETLLIGAAALAGRGTLSLPLLLLSVWSGAAVGDNIGYFLGRRFGNTLIARYGGRFGVTPKRLIKMEAAFAKYGSATVAFARFFVVLRQLNGIVAGTLEMPWWRFLAFNAVGAALWAAAWTAVGYFFGAHGSEIATLAHQLGFIGAGLLAVTAAAAFIYLRRFRKA